MMTISVSRGTFLCFFLSMTACSSHRQEASVVSGTNGSTAALGSTHYETRRDAITAILERSASTPPTQDEVAALFKAVRSDPEWRIKVRAMAVFPFMREREEAIGVLIEATKDRAADSSGEGTVPRTAAKYLAAMKAREGIAAVRDWVQFLEGGVRYSEMMNAVDLNLSKQYLAKLEAVSGA